MRYIILLAGLLTTGCSATKVYDISTSNNGGVPFFPLVVVNKETRQYEQKWLRIDVTLNQSTPFSTGKDTTWKDGTLVTTLYTCDTETDLEQAAKRLLHDLAGVRTLEDATTKLKNASGSFCRTEPQAWSNLADIKKGRLVGYQRGFDQVPANSANYINIWAPGGGSASADIKLDSRGVLSEASAQRQDQLPAAALGVLGTVGAAAVTALGTVAAAGMLSPRTQPGPPGGAPAAEPKLTGITVAVVPSRRLYSLTATWPWRESTGSVPNPCLSAPSVDTQQDGCLMTLTVATESAATPAAPAADKPSK